MSGEVHIWRAQLDPDAWPDASRLPAPERDRAAAIRRPGSSERWVAARWALRTVLGRCLGHDPARVALRGGPNGKPELTASPAPFRFNLSHSGDLALVAVSDEREVGVDVEAIDPRRDVAALARHGLDATTASLIRDAAPEHRVAMFYEAWVRREAIAKCSGVGLAESPSPMTSTLTQLDAGPDHAAALAAAGSNPVTVRLHSLEGR